MELRRKVSKQEEARRQELDLGGIGFRNKAKMKKNRVTNLVVWWESWVKKGVSQPRARKVKNMEEGAGYCFCGDVKEGRRGYMHWEDILSSHSSHPTRCLRRLRIVCSLGVA